MPRKQTTDSSDPKLVDLGVLASKKNFDSYYKHPYTDDGDIPSFNFMTGRNQSAVIVTGSDSAEDVILSAYDDVANMGAGNDIAVGGPGNDTISGGEGRDFLFGDTDLGLGDVAWELDDVLNGDEGDDQLVGDSQNLFSNAVGGDDVLAGGTGNDTLWGDGKWLHENAVGGDDVLIGGTGNDELWGDGILLDSASGGADQFIFGTRDGQDVIRDFRSEDGDQIVLALDEISWVDLDTDNSGTLDDNDLYIQIVNGSTLIDLGSAGAPVDGEPAVQGEHTVLVEGVVGLTIDDFAFV